MYGVRQLTPINEFKTKDRGQNLLKLTKQYNNCNVVNMHNVFTIYVLLREQESEYSKV